MHYYYDRHSVWLDFSGNAHDTVVETSPPVVPQKEQLSFALLQLPPPLDIRKGGMQLGVERHPMEGKP